MHYCIYKGSNKFKFGEEYLKKPTFINKIVKNFIKVYAAMIFRPPMLLHKRPVPIALYGVCRVLCCGQTVPDKPTMCTEVEQKLGGRHFR